MKISSGNILTGTAATLLGLTGAGGVGLYLNNELQEQQTNHTTALGNQDNAWKTKHEGLQADYAELEKALKKYEADLKSVSSKVGGLSNRITTLDDSIETFSKGVGILQLTNKDFSTRLQALNSEIDGVKTLARSEEEKTKEIAKSTKKSVLGITAVLPDGSRASGTAYLVKNLDGRYGIITAGHLWPNAKAFENSIIQLRFPHGLKMMVDPIPMPDGRFAWSGYNGRDLALIPIYSSNEKIDKVLRGLSEHLEKVGVTGLKLASLKEPLEDGGNLVIVGSSWMKEGSVSKGTVSSTNRKYLWMDLDPASPWLGMRRDIQIAAYGAGKGGSGGPVIDSKGKVAGTFAWHEPARVDVAFQMDDGAGGKMVVKGHGSSESSRGVEFIISSGDMMRFLESYDFHVASNDDRNHLIREDIVVDRPALLAPPLLGLMGDRNLYSWLALMKTVEPYAFSDTKK